LFDVVHAALLGDASVHNAMLDRNPAAVASIVARLQDACRRGLWLPRRNAVIDELAVAAARAEARP
jgi:cobaltochelatase CobN